MRSLRPTTYNAFRPVFVLWTVLAFGLLASVLYIGWYDLNNPTLIDYGEGPLMWQAANLFNPARAYAPLDTGPLVIWNYTPGYLFSVRALSNWQGDLLWSGRFVSLLCGLGVATLLFTIIYRALPRRFNAKVRLCAAGTSLLFITSASSMAWFPLMRVDWQGLFFAYLGLFFFLSARSAPWKTVPVSPLGALGTRPALMYACDAELILVGSIIPCAARAGLLWKNGYCLRKLTTSGSGPVPLAFPCEKSPVNSAGVNTTVFAVLVRSDWRCP